MLVERNIVSILIFGIFIKALVDIGVSIFCLSVYFLLKFGLNFNELDLFNIRDVVVVGGEWYVSFGVIIFLVLFNGLIIFYRFYVFKLFY